MVDEQQETKTAEGEREVGEIIEASETTVGGEPKIEDSSMESRDDEMTRNVKDRSDAEIAKRPKAAEEAEMTREQERKTGQQIVETKEARESHGKWGECQHSMRMR